MKSALTFIATHIMTISAAGVHLIEKEETGFDLTGQYYTQKSQGESVDAAGFVRNHFIGW